MLVSEEQVRALMRPEGKEEQNREDQQHVQRAVADHEDHGLVPVPEQCDPEELNGALAPARHSAKIPGVPLGNADDAWLIHVHGAPAAQEDPVRSRRVLDLRACVKELLRHVVRRRHLPRAVGATGSDRPAVVPDEVEHVEHHAVARVEGVVCHGKLSKGLGHLGERHNRIEAVGVRRLHAWVPNDVTPKEVRQHLLEEVLLQLVPGVHNGEEHAPAASVSGGCPGEELAQPPLTALAAMPRRVAIITAHSWNRRWKALDGVQEWRCTRPGCSCAAARHTGLMRAGGRLPVLRAQWHMRVGHRPRSAGDALRQVQEAAVLQQHQRKVLCAAFAPGATKGCSQCSLEFDAALGVPNGIPLRQGKEPKVVLVAEPLEQRAQTFEAHVLHALVRLVKLRDGPGAEAAELPS
mmetsp:Transcript_116807/g.325483  ORF Transcript_116807/g.325483 Transcript_116807/m.325483 type:complete len:408 (-) Transcript_116807:1547-2770(-)